MTATTKILFVSPAGGAYGSERSMLALLEARQFEAEVVCPAEGVLEEELEHIGVKVYPLEFGKYSVKANPLWHIGFYCRFRKILKRSKPQIVVINLDGNTPWVTLAAVRAGIPIVRFSRFEFTPPARWLDRWCWLKAKVVICPSELVRQQVLNWAPVSFHARVHRLYDSYAGQEASESEIESFWREYNSDGSKTIGFVGRLHRGKRIETAITALAGVLKHVDDAKLVVIGGGDDSSNELDYKKELEKLAADLGLRESVTFVGYRPAEDMPAAIASLDVLVLPSESESFGMVLMEAWAQGVPTVASDIGGCREISQASGGGYLAPVGDHQAFSSHMVRLLIDGKRAVTMGANGRAWVIQNCNPSEYANQFLTLIQSNIQL